LLARRVFGNPGHIMRKLLYFLIGLSFTTSCEKEIPALEFRIKSDGYFLENGELYPGESPPSFKHRVSSGLVTFTGEKSTYEFRTGKTSIEEFPFSLPPGEYKMEFSIPEASLYGQKGGSFKAEPTFISIANHMDTVSVKVEANSALFLVRDELDQLDNGIYIIERFTSGEDWFRSYPLTLDTLSGCHYAYFTPDTDTSNPSAYLWFYRGKPGIETGGLSTRDFQIGYQYFIKVLD